MLPEPAPSHSIEKGNTAMQVLWRGAVALIGILLAVSGWFAREALGDLKSSVGELKSDLRASIVELKTTNEETRKSFWEAQSTLTRNQAEYNVKLGVLGEKVDSLEKRTSILEVNQFKRTGP